MTHYAVGSLPGTASESVPIELAAALSGDGNDNLQLRDGDVLTIRQAPGWNDIGASATVRGEVQHAGSYGIRPGERLSSLLERAGGFSPEAYPYGAVLMRREVRELQMQVPPGPGAANESGGRSTLKRFRTVTRTKRMQNSQRSRKPKPLSINSKPTHPLAA